MSWAVVVLSLILCSGCLFRGQRYRNFTTRTPLSQSDILIIGFMGGRESWNNERRSVRQLALKLRSLNDSRLQVETVENEKRYLAIELIRNAFDRNGDGKLDEQERSSARLILYGQSFGGAAVVKLARQLNRMGLPVRLTVQVDSVGLGDGVIPSNVANAANLYQKNGWFVRGEAKIRAEDPAKTTIIGNYLFDYSHKKIDISNVSWMKKAFRVAHTRMEYDPEVWKSVEALIMAEIKNSESL